MDTKLKKSNSVSYQAMFILCVASAMMTWISFLIWNWGHGLRETPGLNFLVEVLSIDVFFMPLYISGTLMSFTITVGLFIYLCVAVGERDEDGNVILKLVDRIFTEFQIIIFFITLGFGFMILDSMPWAWSANFLLIFFSAIAMAIGLWMIMSCVRKLKAGTILTQSIIGKIFIVIYNAVFVGSGLMRKVVVLAVLGCLLSATAIFAPVVLILIFIFIPKWIKKFESLEHGVEEVRSGNLEYKIQPTGIEDLDNLARGINEISQASNIAVQNELKNQRLKAELISNVSHDLRTPLTSMVTYIDLLKTEGLSSETAPEYLDILQQKTNRLRQLTEDLFEAAKASSGVMPVKTEKVDVLSLLNQGLGELNKGITEAGLDIIVTAENEHYYAWADGQLLWRVVENLLVNVLKYTQENTRVYINLTEQAKNGKSGMVIFEIKNISKQALNIDADELMERFTRGDESRTTDGSGLGLAIAKDLVKIQGGFLEIKVDGDLFKVTVMLEKVEE